jgi:hypothetical protein
MDKSKSRGKQNDRIFSWSEIKEDKKFFLGGQIFLIQETIYKIYIFKEEFQKIISPTAPRLSARDCPGDFTPPNQLPL